VGIEAKDEAVAIVVEGLGDRRDFEDKAQLARKACSLEDKSGRDAAALVVRGLLKANGISWGRQTSHRVLTA
jgi:hypothetical protein